MEGCGQLYTDGSSCSKLLML